MHYGRYARPGRTLPAAVALPVSILTCDSNSTIRLCGSCADSASAGASSVPHLGHAWVTEERVDAVVGTSADVLLLVIVVDMCCCRVLIMAGHSSLRLGSAERICRKHGLFHLIVR